MEGKRPPSNRTARHELAALAIAGRFAPLAREIAVAPENRSAGKPGSLAPVIWTLTPGAACRNAIRARSPRPGRSNRLAGLGEKAASWDTTASRSARAAITAEDTLRYAMSLPVATTITGIDKPDVLRQNLQIAQNFKPMDAAEMQRVRDSVKQSAADGRYELYKLSLKFDIPD